MSETAAVMTDERLRELRKAAGMSQAELAEAIGMSRKAIVEMEGGKAPIEKRTSLAVLHVCDLAQAFRNPSEGMANDVALQDAYLLWESDGSMSPPVRVLPLGRDDDRYSSSGGAAWADWAQGSPLSTLAKLWAKVQEMTVIEGIDPREVHRALSVIPEYRSILAPDESFGLSPTISR